MSPQKRSLPEDDIQSASMSASKKSKSDLYHAASTINPLRMSPQKRSLPEEDVLSVPMPVSKKRKTDLYQATICSSELQHQLDLSPTNHITVEVPSSDVDPSEQVDRILAEIADVYPSRDTIVASTEIPNNSNTPSEAFDLDAADALPLTSETLSYGDDENDKKEEEGQDEKENTNNGCALREHDSEEEDHDPRSSPEYRPTSPPYYNPILADHSPRTPTRSPLFQSPAPFITSPPYFTSPAPMSDLGSPTGSYHSPAYTARSLNAPNPLPSAQQLIPSVEQDGFEDYAGEAEVSAYNRVVNNVANRGPQKPKELNMDKASAIVRRQCEILTLKIENVRPLKGFVPHKDIEARNEELIKTMRMMRELVEEENALKEALEKLQRRRE